MSDFYQTFEQRLRGSRKVILGRLEVYASLAESIGVPYALDLGCGRGEWLELLRAWGIHAFGVDFDAEAVASSQDKGLDVRLDDALGVLKEQEDSSLGLVTAFHLVERLPFHVLQDLVQESLRALAPGGMLILETPNPENLCVGASDFYLDPTHQRPLPSKLLSFLVEYTGFERVEILRLQDPWEPAARQAAGLLGALAGVSMDYAVVALKRGTLPGYFASSTEAVDRLIAEQPGVSFELACREYDQNVQRTHDSYDQQLEEVRRVYDLQLEEVRRVYGKQIEDLHAGIARLSGEFAQLRRHSPITMFIAALGRLKRLIAGKRRLPLPPLDECTKVEVQEQRQLVGDAQPLWKASENQHGS